MKPILNIATFALLACIVIFIACKKEIASDREGNSNNPPIANAGPDQVITLPTDSVSLNGGSSNDPGGAISSYLWTKIAGPASFSIQSTVSVKTVVSNLSAGTYRFELTVTGKGGVTARDTIIVIVDAIFTTNHPPMANAGHDQTITLPATTVTIDGSGCSDPEMNIVSYTWTKISGPSSFIIVNANAVQTQVASLAAGIYQFELKVTDAGGLSSNDTVTITVISNLKHWGQLQYLPADDFFFGDYGSWWFNGFNFLMGIDNKVFAISHYGSFWEYNMQTNNWSRIGTFPEQMPSVPVVFAANGKGYCIGDGYCWQYDPVTNQWAQKNDPPDYIHDPLVINNKVYLRGNNNQLLVYDPSADSYTQKNNIPTLGNALLGLFVVNGEGYYVGQTGHCWKYDPATDSWQQKAGFSISGSVSHTSSFSLNNYGYIIGDLNYTAYNDNQKMKVWRYAPSLNQWSQFQEDYPGYGVYYINTVSLSGIVYVGLGYNNGDFNAIDFWNFKL